MQDFQFHVYKVFTGFRIPGAWPSRALSLVVHISFNMKSGLSENKRPNTKATGRKDPGNRGGLKPCVVFTNVAQVFVANRVQIASQRCCYFDHLKVSFSTGKCVLLLSAHGTCSDLKAETEQDMHS